MGVFLFLDTETTGNQKDDRLCQLAYKNQTGLKCDRFFNPGRPISIEAMSVHHITNEMVADKEAFAGSATWRELKRLIENEQQIMVAHNAAFDIAILRNENIEPKRYICTLKLARFLDRDAVIPRYSLQYLRYYLGLKVDARPHDAYGDILVLEALFQRIQARMQKEHDEDVVDLMLSVSQRPSLIRRMPFGKHKGLMMEEVPEDYLRWLLSTDLDEDMAYSVNKALAR
jgi:exodeoxyribonuclease X